MVIETDTAIRVLVNGPPNQRIKLLHPAPANGVQRWIFAEDAVALLLLRRYRVGASTSRGDIAADGTVKRVRWIQECGLHPVLPWQPCWRTQEAAVLPPSPDYFVKMQSSPRG
jgi:hypothetical protein